MSLKMLIPELPNYHHCLAKTPPHTRCYLGECDICPGIETLREELLTCFDETDVEQIVYKLWVYTDRSRNETFCSSYEDFIDAFCEKVGLLRPHSFIATQQASFYAARKAVLRKGEFIVTAYFSENYSFVLQDAAQGYHCNNSQANLYSFVAYYLDSGEVCHLNYVVICDSLHHDTMAVHLFQKYFIRFLKDLLPVRLYPKSNKKFKSAVFESPKVEN